MVNVKHMGHNDDKGFKNRMKFQKYVYLAKRFGLDLGYSHNVHLNGPYSKQLAKECYDIDTALIKSPHMPLKLKSEEFMRMVGNKSADWLEIACTILYEKDFDQTITLERLYLMKSDHSRTFVDSVYIDLKSLGLL